MKDIIFEVCAGSYEDCLAAQAGGADRIELNSALYLGGLTPSMGTVKLVKQHISLPIAAMVRPRAGGFHYTKEEYEVMKQDATMLLQEGVEAIVFGFLNEDFTIDAARTKAFCDLIHKYGGQAVVHRAFDVVKDIDEAMRTLIDCKVDRVLTSGQGETAIAGIETLAYLQNTYGKQIEILGGVGLRADNVKQVLEKTQLQQVHASCKTWKRDLTAKAKQVSYGYANNHELDYECVDKQAVIDFVDALHT